MKRKIMTTKTYKTEVVTEESIICDACEAKEIIYENLSGVAMTTGSNFIEIKSVAKLLKFGVNKECLRIERHYCPECFDNISKNIEKLLQSSVVLDV
jgi:hypothetical protein